MSKKGSHYVEGAGMTEGERDSKLLMFLKCVERGDPPPQRLLEFIAEGVERYYKERQDERTHGIKPTYGPLWPVQTRKRGYDVYEILKAAAMEEAGMHRSSAAKVLELDDLSDSSYYRRIKEGRKQRDVGAASQPWLYRHAIEELLEADRLGRKEKEALRQEADRADPSYPEEEVEPRYGE